MKFASTPIETLSSPLLTDKQLNVSVKRLDLLDGQISGNKWYKLKDNIVEAQKRGADTIVSFGGAYSNHIHALANAGRRLQIKTVGIIRGEAYAELNSTLQDAQNWGMTLEFVSRRDYRRKTEADFLAALDQRYPRGYIIPEGGGNALGVKGCSDIATEIYQQQATVDYIVVAAGTAATFSGITLAAKPHTTVLGIPVLNAYDGLMRDVKHWLAASPGSVHARWQLLDGFHLGGYAKVTGELVQFMDDFASDYGIATEPVYSAKMFKALFELIEQDYFPAGSQIVAVHTGGMQGLRGMAPVIAKHRHRTLTQRR